MMLYYVLSDHKVYQEQPQVLNFYYVVGLLEFQGIVEYYTRDWFYSQRTQSFMPHFTDFLDIYVYNGGFR